MLQRYIVRYALFSLKNAKPLSHARTISNMNLFLMKKLKPPIYQINKSHNLQHDRPEETKFKPRREKPSEFSWLNFAVVFTFGGIMYGLILYMDKVKSKEKERMRALKFGKADIGGQYELTDHTGKTVTRDTYLGNWILIYFGFTHCPDICPQEMEKIVEVTDLIERNRKTNKILKIFVTVDPQRDDVKAVEKYIRQFSPDMIGLTGTIEQIDNITMNYRVHYSFGAKDEDDDYIVDHSINTYLINPKGEFVDYYGQTISARQMADSISLHMLKYQHGSN